MKTYDICIVGAGPAGLTAAIYATRAGKSVVVFEKSTFGGQITFSPKIENYPGFEEISGNDLADRMVSQALGLGADIEPAEVTAIRKEGIRYYVTADGEEYECYSVILATGAEHRRLGLEGEEALIGRGISFCAVCDGAFFAGQKVAVIGGGNSAIVEACLLAESAKELIIVQNLPALTGEKTKGDALLAKENVRAIFNTVVIGYVSENGKLKALKLKNTDGEESLLEVDGAFIAIGLAPANQPFRNNVFLNEYGYIIAGESCDCGRGGIFAAGDCRTKTVRQISTAAADGAVAALASCNYVDGVIEGNPPPSVNTLLAEDNEK